MSPFPVVIDAALLVAWLTILAAVVVRYRHAVFSERRPLLLGGAALAWIAYSLLQLTETSLVTDLPKYAVDGAAILLLTAGLYALYRGWRLPAEPEPDGDDEPA